MDTKTGLNEIPNHSNTTTIAVQNVRPNHCDMATELIANKIDYHQRMYRIVYQMASRDVIITTKR
jgi:hypothetical protein